MAGLVTESLTDRLARVEERIAGAAARAGRDRKDIALVAVTKRFPARIIRDAYEVGLRDFGESYVQEFDQKRSEVDDLDGACFHLIGHLQSNKSALAARIFDSVRTIDNAKLARRLDQTGRDLEVMIEVKLSEEEAKSGVPPEQLPQLIEAVRACPQLRLTGLMTMPPWSEDPETARPYFVRLRELAARYNVTGLSMGMTNDFEVAIEEGATDVRVGTALFGRRPPR